MSNENDTSSSNPPATTTGDSQTDPNTTQTSTQTSEGSTVPSAQSLIDEGIKSTEGEGDKSSEEFTPFTSDQLLNLYPEEVRESVNTDILAQFETIANEHKLPEGAVNALIELSQAQSQLSAEEVQTQATQAIEQLSNEWMEQSRALPEIGGDKLKATLTGIGTLITSTLPPDDVKIFQNEVMGMTGIGNHPVMIKFLNAVAVKLNEAAPTTGSTQSTSRDNQDRSVGFYPTMTQ